MRRVILALSLLTLAIPGWSGRLVAADDTQYARGTVKAVGADWMTVAVGARDIRFTVDEQTSIVAPGGTTATERAEAGARPVPRFGEFVKPGRAVLISYLEQGGAFHALDVHVISSAGPGGGSLSSDRPAVMKVIGTVTRVASNWLAVSAGGRNQLFFVDASTSVLAKGASTRTATTGGRAPIEDVVHAGDRVSIASHEVDAVQHAQDVRVTAPLGASRP
jgi:hypothetical protein